MEKRWQELEKNILHYLKEKAGKPLAEKKLMSIFHLDEEQKSFWNALVVKMLQEGKLIRTRNHLLGIPSQMNLVAGRFSASSKGFGFVIPDDVIGQDIFIAPRDIGGAMNNDRVICRVQRGRSLERKGREGEIIRILERAHKNVVGTFEAAGAYGFVVPDDMKLGSDIFVPEKGIGFAKHGDKVILEISRYPEKGRSAEGYVIDVLGRADDPKVAMESIIFQYGIHQNFPAAVIEEAEAIPQQVPQAAKRGRKDLRYQPMITIDGDDARDLDDAVYVENKGQGKYLLGVHIADVSYYVRPGSELDHESYDRATSVYFPDRVIPMLPRELSNGICSLNAGVDRLAFSCEMLIDRKGKILSFEIFPALIRVAKRLSYGQVKRALVEEEAEVQKELADFMPMLKEMAALSEILKKRRMRRGAIDFDFPEVKVKVDEAGNTIGIVKRERNLAESIIEEFMLAANETVAQYMSEKKQPFIYRIHEKPASEKMHDFDELLHGFGYRLPDQKEIKPKDLQEVLEKVKGEPEERLLSTVMLRSLRQAVYKEENMGHFGLAAEYYTHFTSPIRRYPDLMVHRLLKSQLGVKAGAATNQEKKMDYLVKAAKHSSDQERNAAQAEREAVDLKKVEYMAQFLGEEFDGFISGVTAFGIFVELENGVEGLVRISQINDDYYQYFEREWKLVGQRTGREFRLGDPLKVKLIKASPEERQLTFGLAGDDGKEMQKKPSFSRKKASGSRQEVSKKENFKREIQEQSSKKPKEIPGKKKKSKNPFWKTLKKKK